MGVKKFFSCRAFLNSPFHSEYFEYTQLGGGGGLIQQLSSRCTNQAAKALGEQYRFGKIGVSHWRRLGVVRRGGGGIELSSCCSPSQWPSPVLSLALILAVFVALNAGFRPPTSLPALRTRHARPSCAVCKWQVGGLGASFTFQTARLSQQHQDGGDPVRCGTQRRGVARNEQRSTSSGGWLASGGWR